MWREKKGERKWNGGRGGADGDDRYHGWWGWQGGTEEQANMTTTEQNPENKTGLKRKNEKRLGGHTGEQKEYYEAEHETVEREDEQRTSDSRQRRTRLGTKAVREITGEEKTKGWGNGGYERGEEDGEKHRSDKCGID